MPVVRRLGFVEGRRRGEASDDTVLEWAREFDRDSQMVRLDMSDGDAIAYDGRLWHSTNNRGPFRRTSLLLQYAAADQPMRIPDFGSSEWPFQFTERKPPALVVSGQADNGANWLVPQTVIDPQILQISGQLTF